MRTRRLPSVALAAALHVLCTSGANSASPPAASAGREPDAPISWRQIGADGDYVFGRPARLDRRGWARFGWIVGSGVALYAVRHEAREIVLDHVDDQDRQLVDGARTMGKLATPLAVSLGFYLTGLARDSGYDKETSVMILENLAFAGAVAGTAQYVVATERPGEGDDIRFLASHGHSVSGDVTIAASILAPVIERHLHVNEADGRGRRFWKRFGAAALYGLAGMTALQRMANDRHWLPDVYFGYANGLMMGKMLADSHRGGRGWRERSGRRVDVHLSASGLTITWPVGAGAGAQRRHLHGRTRSCAIAARLPRAEVDAARP